MDSKQHATTKATRSALGDYDITIRATGEHYATITPDLYGGGQFGTGRAHQEGWAILTHTGKRVRAYRTLAQAKAVVEAAAAKRAATQGG